METKPIKLMHTGIILLETPACICPSLFSLKRYLIIIERLNFCSWRENADLFGKENSCLEGLGLSSTWSNFFLHIGIWEKSYLAFSVNGYDALL
jgi:hypothetical protein